MNTRLVDLLLEAAEKFPEPITSFNEWLRLFCDAKSEWYYEPDNKKLKNFLQRKVNWLKEYIGLHPEERPGFDNVVITFYHDIEKELKENYSDNPENVHDMLLYLPKNLDEIINMRFE